MRDDGRIPSPTTPAAGVRGVAAPSGGQVAALVSADVSRPSDTPGVQEAVKRQPGTRPRGQTGTAPRPPFTSAAMGISWAVTARELGLESEELADAVEGGCAGGSQPTLQRKQIKGMLRDWEKKFPGRVESTFRAMTDVRLSHLMDRTKFDFAAVMATGAPERSVALRGQGAARPKLSRRGCRRSQSPLGGRQT